MDQKEASLVMQLPQSYCGISSFWDLSDESLADLSWARLPHIAVLSKQAAIDAGISVASIESAEQLGSYSAIERLREERDALLSASDDLISSDRFDSYSADKKKAIIEYRQSLRDVTKTANLFNPLLPSLVLEADPAEEAREDFKRSRSVAVEKIVVTVGDKTFNGDEVSQNRMVRTIVGLGIAEQPGILWTLADNTRAFVTVSELSQALLLAGQAQSEVWAAQ